MILINKAEAEIIRANYPNIIIPRTCKQKSNRHRYYLVEDEKLLRLIASTNLSAREIVGSIDARRKPQKFRGGA